MPELLDDVCCASLPVAALSLLAALRTRPGVRVKLHGDRAWVYWTAGDDMVLRRVLPVRGAEVFARQDEHWFRPGRSLPAFGVHDETGALPLAQVVVPAPVYPVLVEAPAFARVRLTLVRDGRPRTATALLCRLDELTRWADGVTATRFASLRAALCGDLVLVRGERLPELAGAERFWGVSVLTPLGWRPEPALSERELGRALGLGADDLNLRDDLALLTAAGAEVIAGDLFRAVTRAGLRLAPGGRA